MTNALAFGNTMLVAHLLSSGYDANTVTGVGFTILYHALRHGAGIGAIKLLEHGADPTCSSPARQAGPLTIISFAPEGTHTDEVVRRLIDGGNTYDKEKESFIQLYHRAVIEGWDSTADLLIQNGLPREPSDRQLLKILLGQNSGRPLRGIKYLIKHASAKLVKDSRVDQETGDNVFHRLFGIQETIRNDELNFAILQLLLEVFGDPIMLNAPNKRGYSPATKAAHEGNFRAIEALGRHGVDISIGRPSPSPVQVVAGRIICPDKFDGDISTASSRGRKKRRYAENTTGLLRFLLGHFHPLGHSQDENEAIVRRRITLWQSSRFLEEAVRSGVDATSKESTIQVELDPDPASQTGFMVLETETGIRRSGNWKEMVMVTQNIWNAIVQDWNDTKTGNELGA
jgi:ankyrin repeat protein